MSVMTDLTTTFIYKLLLTYQRLSQLAANCNYLYTNTRDGWNPAESSVGVAETWAYASASTITVPAGAASRYKVGDKIKITQPTLGVKYFNLGVVADTLLTVVINTDYTIADEAITSPYSSKADNPSGFPTSFTFAPAAAGFTGAVTYAVSEFSIHGRTCHVNVEITGTSNATSFTWELPIASAITQRIVCLSTDNGTQQGGNLGIAAGDATVTHYANMTAIDAVYTNSGTKGAKSINFTYPF